MLRKGIEVFMAIVAPVFRYKSSPPIGGFGLFAATGFRFQQFAAIETALSA